MPEVEEFKSYCIVEVMGHKKFAGHVSEQTIGGASFVRVDVPEVSTETGVTLPAFSKLFGAASIYCLSPCTEETARAFAASIRSESFSKYEAPRLPYREPSEPSSELVTHLDDEREDDDYYDEPEEM